MSKWSRRELLKASAAGAAAVLGGLPAAGRAADAPGPVDKANVIVILTDDHGWGDVGFNGCKDIPTPHIDSIARGGIRFTCGYVSHPFCSPTRAGLLTGRYQQRFGHECNPLYDPKDEKLGLPLDQMTIAQAMKRAGYVTGQIGKWHLGATPAFHPLRRGFDEHFGFLGGGHDYFKAGAGPDQREYMIPIERNGQPVQESEYLTDALSREAAAFVRRHKDKPFFLYLAYNAPHTPLQVTDKYLQRVSHIQDKNRRPYGAMICAVDDGVGGLLAALKQCGIASRTLVIFLGDNGGAPAIAGGPPHANNGPLRGGKGSLFEGGIRVPFAAYWPGVLPAGKECTQPVSSLDIFPTALTCAGATIPPNLDGVNLLPYLKGEQTAPPHQRLFWRAGGGATWAVREGKLKLVKPPGGGRPLLFDLEADEGEKTDLAAAQSDTVQRLQAAYEEWNKQLVGLLWGNPKPAAKAAAKKK